MQPAPPGKESVEGQVERVTFHSEETGFCVLRVSVRGEREPVPVIGTIPQIVAGEMIKAHGQWVMDKTHGRQFKAERISAVPPNSPEGIVKFLGSGLVKGIGPVYAQRLVDKFGKDVFDIIEHNSARLQDVEGIGTKRRQRIKQSWIDTQGTRAIMAFLISHGVSTARAFRIHKTYGEEAIQTVEANPYVLARDIRGIGFKTADQIARNFGIEHDDPRRAEAGIEYVLHECTREGHVAFPHMALVDEAEKILGIKREPIEDAIQVGLDAKRLVQDEIGGNRLIYLSSLYECETQLAARVRWFAGGTPPLPEIDADKAVSWAAETTGLDFAESQRDAIRRALQAKMLVITGGPGVGKTTILNAILKILAAKGVEMLLAAPTGRAAKRMAEATGRESKTIHRLLAWDPKAGAFKHKASHPLRCDLLVVDEASMIDLPLMHSLVQAVPEEAGLILVGDVDQLPSVGPGTVLRDLMESGVVPVARLTEVFRQAAESGIVSNAHRVNRGEHPSFGRKNSNDDFYFVKAEEPEEAVRLIVKLTRENIPRKFTLDPRRDIQILTPMQRGVLGARNLNLVMQQALNPSGKEVERFGTTFREGDKVMQTSNNYDKDVYNGDLGIVVSVNATERETTIQFGSKKVEYDFNEMDELVLAYATTIHKSQGSEYPCVVMPVHTTHYVMLQRNLIYTGITRGKQLVMLVGTEKAVAMAIKNQDSRLRVSALRDRLAE